MDRRFLQHYERELRFVRELGFEFARKFPKVAGRLGISELACDDPHVERLFQGFAFLSAGVSQRLDGEFPRFTTELLESVYPLHLGPTPSMAVVQLAPSAQAGALSNGFAVPRDASLRTRSSLRGAAACEYRTAHDVELWPIEITQVEYTSVLRDVADLHLPSRQPIRALLRLRLRTSNGRSFNQLQLQRLPIYLRGPDERSTRLYEALLAHASGLVLRWGHNPALHTARSSAAQPVRALGFADEHALLPHGPAGFRGYRLLQEYFAFPARFHFAELCGLETGVRRCDRDQLDVIVPLTRHDPALQGAIEPDRVLLYATPAINLFPTTCDRITVTNPAEFLHIVPDRARPLDFEIYKVTRVAAFVQGTGRELDVAPQRALRGRLEHDGAGMHYALERRPRLVTSDEQRLGQRSAYAGTEMYLSLLDRTATIAADTRQLSIETLCTNRDLPLSLTLGRGGNDFSLDSGAPVDAVFCVAGPSVPRACAMEGDLAWRLISQLSLNYLSLSEGTGGAEAMRELLAVYAQLGDPQLRREVEGLRTVSAAPVIRPMPGPGPRHFVRGLEVRLSCDEQAFAVNGAFTLASVLSEFFAKHATEHSFTETVLIGGERGEIHRWPAIAGTRHTL